MYFFQYFKAIWGSVEVSQQHFMMIYLTSSELAYRKEIIKKKHASDLLDNIVSFMNMRWVAKLTLWTPFKASTCLEDHPYAYQGGSYCCRHPFEDVDHNYGESCDGSRLSLESVCCLQHDYAGCDQPPCADFPWEDPEDGNFLKEIRHSPKILPKREACAHIVAREQACFKAILSFDPAG